MADILIVDDDHEICESLRSVVEHMGHTAFSASSVTECREAMHERDVEIVLLDVRLPDGSGLELLPLLRAKSEPPEVIVLTGFGDPDGAQLAIENGAWDYLEKPSSIDEISLHIERALAYRREKYSGRERLRLDRAGIVGRSVPIRRCLDVVAQAAASSADTLISGETGTGKELFAWAIHKNSPRAHRSFVVVDCAALPENLVESILFGHVRGAFTGANRSKEGLVKQADGGTLFLDEIGELPLNVQATFLRVLQERVFRPVGSSREQQSNFRLIAATNRDLDEYVEIERFRADLLFRLRAFHIRLPPLRERPEDIRELALHHLDTLAERTGSRPKGYSPDFFETLAAYDWPGNVRELFQAVERAHAAAGDEAILFARHLPTKIRAQTARASIEEPGLDAASPDGSALGVEQTAFDPTRTLKEYREMTIAQTETSYLAELMQVTNGNIAEACRISGLSRSRLYALLKKYGLPRRL